MVLKMMVKFSADEADFPKTNSKKAGLVCALLPEALF